MRRLRQWRGLLQLAALMLGTAAAQSCEQLMDTGMGAGTVAGIVACLRESAGRMEDTDGANATRANGQTALHE